MATQYGLDKISTTYGTSIWRSDIFRIGKKFNIDNIRIPFAQALAANMTLTLKIYGDDGSTTPSAANKTSITINNTNYPNSDRAVNIKPLGQYWNNFFIQLEWSGSALATVALPIEIELSINE